MALGIDIYRYQTVTDWSAVKRAVAWAYVKLTDGGAPALVRGDSQVNGARSVGLPVGGYHYAQLNPSPETQADVFLAEVARLDATALPPALDLEAPFGPDAGARDFGIRFCRRVAAAGFRPAVYMSASFAGALRPDQWGIPGLVIWLAAYGNNSGAGYTDAEAAKIRRYYSGRYDVHQFTSNGTVPGISGRVDINWDLTGIAGSGQGGGAELDSEERNALFSIYNAMFKNNTGAIEHQNQGDQSLITRLVELQQTGRALLGRDPADVDEAELAAALAPHLPSLTTHLSDEDLARLVTASADEADRRARERLGSGS